jgi:RHS repeat-associated protein
MYGYLAYILVPTPSPTPTTNVTPVFEGDSRWGTGNDGSLTVASGNTYNISTQNNGSRTCSDGGDAVAYSVTQLYETYAILSSTPSAGCLAPNDEILLTNMQGSSTATLNAGNYEFLRVAWVSGNTVYFNTQKVLFYGDSFQTDTNIGINSGQQRVVIQRVPNYNNVTVNGTLTASDWNGYRYGMIAFRVSGTLGGSGAISANYLGYRGGAGGLVSGNANGSPGESYGSTAGVNGGGMGGVYGTWSPDGGGGGYSAVGDTALSGTPPALGGRSYGVTSLNQLFLGSGGGGGARNYNGEYTDGTPGGDGGGIILIQAQAINFGGQLSSRGQNGGYAQRGAPDYPAYGGAGSGGSIRIEGQNVALGTADVTGGPYADHAGGAPGRIAVYYMDTYSANFTPGYLQDVGQSEATPTTTPLANVTFPYGDGRDGDLTVDYGTTFNFSTQTKNQSFNCADGGDGVAYIVTGLSASSATLNIAPGSGCLSAGDEIMLINLMGWTTNFGNVGVHEFLIVGSVNSTTVTFTSAKVNFYGNNLTDDSNIGTGTGQQRVMLQRVPNYNNVTVNGTLTASDFNGYRYGLIVFRVKGTLSGTGAISADYLGYRGGAGASGDYLSGAPGESFGATTGTNGAGEGGTDCYPTCWSPDGGGGGYSRIGATAALGSPQNLAQGGKAYGSADLSRLYFGSGGGGGARNFNGEWSGGTDGGDGGGIIFLQAQTISFDGQMRARGQKGGDGTRGAPWYAAYGGAGSGGSIRIAGDDVNLNSVNVSANLYPSYASGAPGRIAVYYANSFSSHFSPGYLLNTTTGLLDSISNEDFEYDLDNWVTPTPENPNLSISSDSVYWGTSGLKVIVADNSDLYAQDNAPSAESSYRARAYFNLDGLTMATNDLFTLFSGKTGSGNSFEVQIQMTATTKQIRLVVYKDDTSTVATSWYDLTAHWRSFEVQIQAAGIANANDGVASLYLDGILKQSLTGIDNDTTAIDSVRLGVVGIDSGTRGVISIDNYESRRFSTIGLLADPGNEMVSRIVFIYELLRAKYGDAYTPPAATGIFTDMSGNPLEAWAEKAYADGITSGCGTNPLIFCPNNLASRTEVAIFLLRAKYNEPNEPPYQPPAVGDSTGFNDVPVTAFGAAWIKELNVEGIAIGCGGGNYCPNATVPAELARELIKRTLHPTVPTAEYHYADPDHLHAVTSVDRGTSTDTYTYDANGNMTCRVENGKTYDQSYNVENRMDVVLLVSGTCANHGTLLAGWAFTYDGDGNRVRQVYTDGTSTLTTYYFFRGSYEVQVSDTSTTAKVYYAFAGMMVAMRTVTGSGSTLVYFLTDHLGSVIAVTDENGTLVSERRYLPFGQVRTDVGNLSTSLTDFGYTGQRNLDAQNNANLLGLMDYKARFYDSYLMRWTQPDTIIPSSDGPQGLNRYSYSNNNPINYNDPTGHCSRSRIIDDQIICFDSPHGITRYTPQDDLGKEADITNELEAQSTSDEAIPITTSTNNTASHNANNHLVNDLNGAAAFFQFLALLVDVPMGGAEVIAAGIVCGVTIEAGCIPGATEVVLDFNILYNTTPLGIVETGFSFISSALTITADFLDDGKFGEATSTAVFTFLAGAINPDPALDAVIDLYGMGYATGAFNGIETIMNGGPIRKKH